MESLLSKTLLIIACFLSYSSCERSTAKSSENDSACFAIANPATGFDDIYCNGKLANLKACKDGEKGERGANGSPGSQGPTGPAGSGSLSTEKVCQFDLPNANKTLVTYTIYKSSDETRIAALTIQQDGPDAGVFPAVGIYLSDSDLFEFAPVSVNEYEAKLVSNNQAFIRHRITNAHYTFDCN